MEEKLDINKLKSDKNKVEKAMLDMINVFVDMKDKVTMEEFPFLHLAMINTINVTRQYRKEIEIIFREKIKDLGTRR